MSMNTQELKSQVEVEMLDHEDVTGVGIGEDKDGNEVVVVNVKHGKAHTLTLPSNLDTSRVEVRETGDFRPEVVRADDSQNIDRKGRHRPVPMGVSAGHVDVTAGTTGYIVTDGSTQYVSSNNHVYANVNQGSTGDNIIQPGSADGGTAENDISATLADYIPIENGVTVDFAWASTNVEHTNEIAGIGKPVGEPVDPQVGDRLTKAGRTTGVTEGVVEQVDVSLNVNFGDAGSITINDTVITENMSQGGDSGSAVLDKSSMRPAGILFAGSSSATAHCKATNIESETGLTIVTGDKPDTPTARVTLTLEQTTSQTGNAEITVVDTNNNPVQGSSVSMSGPESRSGTTDTSGVISFTSLPIGEYSVTADKEGYSSASATVTSSDFS